MLQSLNCPDVKIADESAVGFNDDIPESGVFEARTTDNGVKGQSRGWLWRKAVDVRCTLAENSKAASRAEKAVTQEVYDRTVEEASNGCPHSPEEFTAVLKPRWAPSRRLGTRQAAKLVLSTISSRACQEKVSVDGVVGAGGSRKYPRADGSSS